MSSISGNLKVTASRAPTSVSIGAIAEGGTREPYAHFSVGVLSELLNAKICAAVLPHTDPIVACLLFT